MEEEARTQCSSFRFISMRLPVCLLVVHTSALRHSSSLRQVILRLQNPSGNRENLVKIVLLWVTTCAVVTSHQSTFKMAGNTLGYFEAAGLNLLPRLSLWGGVLEV